MKRLKLLIPTTALFLSPWMHKLVFENIMLAFPSADVSAVHFLALMGSVVALGASVMISVGEL